MTTGEAAGVAEIGAEETRVDWPAAGRLGAACAGAGRAVERNGTPPTSIVGKEVCAKAPPGASATERAIKEIRLTNTMAPVRFL